MSPSVLEAGRLLIEIFGVIAVVLFYSLSPRLKQLKPVEFKYPRRELTFALVMLGLSIIVAVVFAWPNLSGNGPFNSLQARYNPLMWASLVSLVLAAGLMLYRRQPIRSIGWNQALTSTGMQFGITIILLLLFLLGKAGTLMRGIEPDMARLLLPILVAAIAGETVFRGYIQPRIESRWGFIPALLVAGLAAAAFQAFFLLGVESTTTIPLVLMVLVRSLLAGWIYKRCPHVLAPALYLAIATWIALI